MVVLWGYGLGGTGAGGAEKSDPCEIDENTPDKRYCGIYDKYSILQMKKILASFDNSSKGLIDIREWKQDLSLGYRPPKWNLLISIL